MSETSNSDICKYCNKKDFPCEDYCPWRTCSARNLCEKQHQEKTMTEEKKTPTFNEIIGSFNEKCHCDYDNDYETEDCRPCDYCKILYPDYESRECYQNGAWTPGCSGCSDSQGECLNYYIYEVATGKRPLDKPLWNQPKVELPEWFKVGAKVWRWGRLPTKIESIEHLPNGKLKLDFACLCGDEECGGIETTDELTIADFAEKPNLLEVVKVGSWLKHRDELAPSQVTAIADGKIYIETAGDGLDDWIGAEDFDNIKPVKFRPYKSIEELEALIGKKLRFTRQVKGGVSTVVETITSVEYDPCNGEVDINNHPYEFLSQNTSTIDGLPIGVPVVDEETL